jgi:hypothetical protein
MAKIKLTEAQLRKIVKRVIREQEEQSGMSHYPEVNDFSKFMVNDMEYETITNDQIEVHIPVDLIDGENTYFKVDYEVFKTSSYSEGDYYTPSYYDEEYSCSLIKENPIKLYNNDEPVRDATETEVKMIKTSKEIRSKVMGFAEDALSGDNDEDYDYDRD